jgi:hypothetical protein
MGHYRKPNRRPLSKLTQYDVDDIVGRLAIETGDVVDVGNVAFVMDGQGIGHRMAPGEYDR